MSRRGEVMSLGVIADAVGSRVCPAEEARPHHVLDRRQAGSAPSCSSRCSPTSCRSSTPTAKDSVLDGKQPPSLDHWFGTDSNGRDIFSRFVYGARVSLAIGIASLVFGLTIGGFLGLIAGYHRRRTDTFITTIMDILLAFPALVLALMLVTFGQAPDGGDRHFEIGPISFTLSRLWLVILVLSVLSIPPLTRVVRASTLTFAQPRVRRRPHGRSAPRTAV